VQNVRIYRYRFWRTKILTGWLEKHIHAEARQSISDLRRSREDLRASRESLREDVRHTREKSREEITTAVREVNTQIGAVDRNYGTVNLVVILVKNTFSGIFRQKLSFVNSGLWKG